MLLLLSLFQFLIFIYSILVSALLFFGLHYKHFVFYGFLFILFIVSIALCLVSLFEYAFVMRWFLIYSSALAPLGTYGYPSTLRVGPGRNLETKHLTMSLVVCLLVRLRLGVDFIY